MLIQSNGLDKWYHILRRKCKSESGGRGEEENIYRQNETREHKWLSTEDISPTDQEKFESALLLEEWVLLANSKKMQSDEIK